MQSLLVGAMTAVLTVGAVALTQKTTVSFADLDKDGDGRISVTEATAHRKLSRAFPEVDVNRDDYVSEREFRDWVNSQSRSADNRSQSRLVDDSRVQAAIPAPQMTRW